MLMHTFGSSAPLRAVRNRIGLTLMGLLEAPRRQIRTEDISRKGPRMTNPLLGLAQAGQSVWLDYFNPKILEDGELTRLIEKDGLKGMTVNPSIFEKAISEDRGYDGRIKALLEKSDLAAGDLYEQLAVADVQAAADQFRAIYDHLEGADGYVSLEVSPYLAMDTKASVAEARRLWRAVDRPNLMIKIPGTEAGGPAIASLSGRALTPTSPCFSASTPIWRSLMHTWQAGIAGRQSRQHLQVHGVASFFVSRIDAQIDKEIDRRIEAGGGAPSAELKALRGKVAIANAKVAYQHYLEMLKSPRWKGLAAAGAPPQRLLWASTGTKDPAYSDVLYVESLIGPDTINTIPVKTLDAFRDHGRVRTALTDGLDEARSVLDTADRLGLDLNDVTERLVVDGVHQFTAAFDKLLAALVDKRAQFVVGELNRQALQSLAPPARSAKKPG